MMRLLALLLTRLASAAAALTGMLTQSGEQMLTQSGEIMDTQSGS